MGILGRQALDLVEHVELVLTKAVPALSMDIRLVTIKCNL